MNIYPNFHRLFQRRRQAAILWLVVGGLFCATTGSAQVSIAGADATATNRLTLSDCSRLALTQNPLLKASAADQTASHEAVGEARASYYPTLGVRGGVSRWQSHAFLPSGIIAPDISSVVGPTDDWSAGGFARYVLYDGGVRRAALDAAKAAGAATGANNEVTRLSVLFDVHQAFYELAVAIELRTVADKSLANAESHFGAAKDRQAVGDTTESDVLRAQVELDNAKAELIRARTLIHTAKGNLNIAMGLPAELPVDIAEDVDSVTCTNAMDVAAFVQQALEIRPEVKALQSTVEGARHQVQAAKASFLPKVYAEASYGWRDDNSSLDDEAWSIGAMIEFTAFEGFFKRHSLARARAEAARSEAMLERVQLAVRRDVWTAFARVQESEELVHAAATQAQHAEESLRLMSARYKVGAATVTDLLDAQTALTAAQVQHVQARWGCQHAQATLRRAIGTLTEE